MRLYPLKFEPIYKKKLWGGRRLQQLARKLPGHANSPIGESWELADLARTAPDGGGGDPAESVVALGPLAGQSLHALIDHFGSQLIGDLPLAPGSRFPLLVKYLDAHDNLSVQAHPTAAYARKHPDAHLKDEAWYIVDAAPGSMIYKGLRPGLSADDVRRAASDGSIGSLLNRVPAHVGDCHYLPSGMCHALGAGVMVAEVQTPSDTTFRLFDWGRGRATHVEQALACMSLQPVDTRHEEPGNLIQRRHTTVEVLVNCDHFRIEKTTAAPGYDEPVVTNHEPHIWMILTGSGRIESAPTSGGSVTGSGAPTVTPFTTGDTLLLPAELDDPHLYLDAHTEWLHITLPAARNSQIA